AGGSLTAAGFSHQAKSLTLVNVEAHAIDGADIVHGSREDPLLDWEVNLKIFHRKQRGFAFGNALGIRTVLLLLERVPDLTQLHHWVEVAAAALVGQLADSCFVQRNRRHYRFAL